MLMDISLTVQICPSGRLDLTTPKSYLKLAHYVKTPLPMV